MFLILTADQRFWKKNEKILFLGEWCKIYNQKHIWSSLDYEVLPYHWDDRKKLYQDYLYLDDVYERYLVQLTVKLNLIHSTDHSERYWRIIIGPWLYYFIQILYDRYLSILVAAHSQLVEDVAIISESKTEWIPMDLNIFNEWATSDPYSHYLYSRVIEYLKVFPFHISPWTDVFQKNKFSKTKNLRNNLKNSIKTLVQWYQKYILSFLNRIVFIESYIPTFDLLKLQLSLRQLPYLVSNSISINDISAQEEMREKIILSEGKNKFELLLDRFVADQIPKVYIEGYHEMSKRALCIFPKKPKAIYTANAYIFNDGFKFWTATNIERGVQLLGTQHGGFYGAGLWSSEEAHEINISDRYYTWGWGAKDTSKITPLCTGKFTKIKKILKQNSQGMILVVGMSMPRYSYWMYSVPIGPQMLDYIYDQGEFMQALSSDVRKISLFRLYMRDYGWNEEKRFKDMDATVKLYTGEKSMYEQLCESRLFIGTYNGTTFLETFVANFPTVLFWNPKHWELRESAQPYYDELKRVGILHDTPESAAKKVNEIYQDPMRWWKQKDVQSAKDIFCREFAWTADDWMKRLRDSIVDMTKK